MKRNIEDALSACGRDRVMHREFSGRPAVAIRWDQDLWNLKANSPDSTEKFLVKEADTLDEAGKMAAEAFAIRLREIAKAYTTWADRIEQALK